VKGYFVLDASCSVKNWLGRRSHVVALVMAVLAVNSAATQEILFLFNIPAQPLAVALEQYSAVTGRDLLYNSNLAAGWQSNRVQGRLSADGALGLLLEGTGLSAQRITQTSFVLSPVSSAMDPSTPAGLAAYYGQIQNSLRQALCHDSLTRPGSYRIAIRFRVDAAGTVTQYEQFGSGGSNDVDAAIQRAVSRLRIGGPPPNGSGQPFVIVILPQAPGLTGCEAVATRTP
jgi:hypothetical protein